MALAAKWPVLDTGQTGWLCFCCDECVLAGKGTATAVTLVTFFNHGLWVVEIIQLSKVYMDCFMPSCTFISK